MLTLLSPAKKLNMDPAQTGLDATQPRLHGDMREIAAVAKQQSADDLKRLMHISDNLAALNFERFKAFNLNNQSNSAKPAGITAPDGRYTALPA